MTILVCLGQTPDTWWQAKNEIGRVVLERAEALSQDESTRKEIEGGRLANGLRLDQLEFPLRSRVWAALQLAADEIAASPPANWPSEWVEHVADLAREMKLRRESPDRPGAWPVPQA